MLIIFGGLPGVGKTTIAQKLAQTVGAVHLRIDTIETAIANSDLHAANTNAGYLAAYGIAKDNLLIGRSVIADSVNSHLLTRDAWREVAKSSGTEFVEIEIICSDKKEHKNRVETRTHNRPTTWQQVLDRDYEDWEPSGVKIDSTKHSIAESVKLICDLISQG